MSVMDAEVFEAFRAIGVPDDKASAAAQAISRRDADIGPLKADVATLKNDMSIVKSDTSAMKLDITTMKLDIAVLKWGVGLIVAGVISLMLKAFVH
jgi:hypothetical protein